MSHRKMRITFGVIANHCGEVNRNTANYFLLIYESLFKRYRKKTLFWSSPLYRQNFPLLDTFYVYDSQLRITLSNCIAKYESLLTS